MIDNCKKLSELTIGDKFWYNEVPYLVIDLKLNNLTIADFSNLKFVLNLVNYKVVCFNTTIEVEQDKDNIPV